MKKQSRKTFKGGSPRWERRFRKLLTAQDLITGRKVIQRTTDDEGNEHVSIERVRKTA